MTEKKNKKNPSLGCLFWIAFILLIIVIFFFNKTNISTALENTGAKDLLKKNGKSTELTDTNPTQVVPKINTKEDTVIDTGDQSTKTNGDGSNEVKTPKQDSAVTKPDVKTPDVKTQDTKKPDVKNAKTPPASNDKTAEPAETVTQKTPKQNVQATPAVPTRKSSLYFVSIDADGKVLRKQVTREIAQTDSPLSETINALLKGTNSSESGKGLRSLIPEGTKLLSATVKDGVATVNLSDQFQFNQFGIEGYLGQLEQIVFTATSFSTVKSVQFLIEGQRHEYLGAEGVWIGTPLNRDKF